MTYFVRRPEGGVQAARKINEAIRGFPVSDAWAEMFSDKAEERGFCATGMGGGIDNSCGAKTMSAPDKDGGGGSSPAKPDTWGDNTWAGEDTPASLSHLGSLKVWSPRTEEDVAQLAGSMGITSPSDLLTIGACNIKDAEVEIDGLGMKILTMRADIPAGKGKIKIDTAIALEDSGPTINYGYLALDTAALTEAVNDPKVSSRYGGQIYGAMLASMETAEKAGFVSATTTAEGYGPGNTNGRRTDLQGYRLWGRFGFDGDIPKGWFARVASKDVDVESVLSPEANRSLKASGTVRLQQLLATKQGENIWKQWGVPIELEFDFTNKTSDGYKRYQDMLALSKRTKNRRSFFEYVYGLELRDDPSLWSGFVEQRVFCPNGEGNGITNDCGPGQTAKSFPEGSQNLRDAVDSVAPAPEQVWDRSKGLAETPPAKQMDDIANEQTSNTGVALTPEAEASYGSLVDEIGRQYEALTAAGLKARAWRGDGEPYGDPPGSTKPNSDKMRQEVAKTGEFSFFMTDKGFGTGDATPDHPMLRETKFKTADGEPMIANDLFRVVHDMVAHVRGGYSFSTNGEYNGMLTHASTLPEAAWPALFAETFGQNAVYEKTKNYAPQNAYASKVGPEIIRSELKKRTKSSRAAKKDGDEPLGYQHIKSRPALLKSLVEQRAFCPNGKGNGVTNTCRVGINVNDKDQDFTGQILSGAKTTETRITNSLKPYIGKTVGIVRTGKGTATLVGTMKVGEPKFYKTSEEFDADFDKHQIAKGSPHYIGSQGKYGYPLSEVQPVEPVKLPPGGRIARVLHKSNREMTVEFDLGGESPEHPKQSRSSDCGRDDDGRFSSGNKCGGQVDMPKEDPRGRMRYESGVQTDAARKLYQMGTSEKKLKGLVETLGGDVSTTRADINPPSVDLTVADKDGNKLFHIEVQNGRARLYPTKDLSDDELGVIKNAASEAFAGRDADTKIKVFAKASDMKSWEKENAAKIKKWEDKYRFSVLLPPHERPKKWERSLDARYASLLAFTESRGFCPNGEGNGVTNTCSSKDGGGHDKVGNASADKQEFFGTLLDSKATHTTIQSDSGPITVIDRKDVTNSQYLDDIEAEGEHRGLVTSFDDAVETEMQKYSPIYEDEGPYAAFVRSGCSLMSGTDCGKESNADETIDYNGTEYGTISEDHAEELVNDRIRELLVEYWDDNVDPEKEFIGWSGFTDDMKKMARDSWIWENEDRVADTARQEVEEQREAARQAAIPQMRRDLEKDLARTELECCLQLYRGMNLPDEEIERILKDGVIGHEGANSWTTSKATARGFGGNDVLLVLRSPAVGHIYQTDHSGEREITRPPSKMRIVGVVKTKGMFDTDGTVLYVEEDPDYKRRRDDE